MLLLELQVGKQIHAYGKGVTYERVMQLLEQVGLPVSIIHKPPLGLSSGQQRLLAIACALCSGANFIVLDEPMAGLDRSGRNLVKDHLLNLQHQGKTTWLTVSHHPDDLLGLVEDLWVMDQGRMIYRGSFRKAPIAVLEQCLGDNDPSIFCHMRRAESRGMQVPPGMYARPDISWLVSALSLEKTNGKR